MLADNYHVIKCEEGTCDISLNPQLQHFTIVQPDGNPAPPAVVKTYAQKFEQAVVHINKAHISIPLNEKNTAVLKSFSANQLGQEKEVGHGSVALPLQTPKLRGHEGEGSHVGEINYSQLKHVNPFIHFEKEKTLTVPHEEALLRYTKPGQRSSGVALLNDVEKIKSYGVTPEDVTSFFRKNPTVRYTQGLYKIPPSEVYNLVLWGNRKGFPIEKALYNDVVSLGYEETTVIDVKSLTRKTLQVLPSITPQKAKKFANYGVENLQDLLNIVPHRYIDRSSATTIQSLKEGEEAGFIGAVQRIEQNYAKKFLKIFVKEENGTSAIGLTFFNASWMSKKFTAGDKVVVFGKPERWKIGAPLSMTNPIIEHYHESVLPVIPVYPQSGKNNISSVEISRAVKEVAVLFHKLQEPLSVVPPALSTHVPKTKKGDALAMVHMPLNTSDVYVGKHKLIFDELFSIQLSFSEERKKRALSSGFQHPNTTLAESYVKSLPYPLTGSQNVALKKVVQCMKSSNPMHLLLQGDVGAGKAQPYSSKILTPSGYVPFSEISVGDAIVNPSGESSYIEGIYPQGERECSQLHFDDGTTVEADLEHLWVAHVCNAKKENQLYCDFIPDSKNFSNLTVMTTYEMKNLMTEHTANVFVPTVSSSITNNSSPEPLTSKRSHLWGKKVTKITPTGQKNVVCIKVSHPNSLYITDNATVTHNTTVAVASLLTAVGSGSQTALMAPTEILAKQLYDNVVEACAVIPAETVGRPLVVEFFSNQLKGKRREEKLQQLADGRIDVAVGTHALLVPDVKFHNLTLVVIDEQHRFGVEQREVLRNKTLRHKTPDTLVMTATPIPRTAVMSIFGDLDVAVLTELPPGRTPVVTEWIDETPNLESASQEPWVHVREEIKKGRQVFVVCPLVEESETLEVASAMETYEVLKFGALQGFTVGVTHGQQKTEEKEQVMKGFKNGDIQVLVSTTVVEVGVNIPNASVMVILDPGRFGISQLHQLRGRVGRGAHKSTCYLYGVGRTPETRERLTALTETNDGFKLSEIDLKIRGHGSIFGSQQSGMSDFYYADLRRDEKVLEKAQKTAELLMENLDNPKVIEVIKSCSNDTVDLSWLSKS